MSEPTSEDFNKLIDAMTAQTRLMAKASKTTPSSKGPGHGVNSNYRGSVGDEAAAKKLIQSQGRLSGATEKVTDGLKKTVTATVGLANKFGALSGAAGNLTSSLSTVARAFGAGGAVMAIANQLDKTTDTYRQLNAVGQSFGGSLLNMQQAAADAALPLEAFAEVIKNNSVVMATVGAKSFFDMSKQLRTSMTDIGMLGMTTSQLNNFMGKYMETQRLYGNSSGVANAKTVEGLKSLAIESQKAAEMTGMNRDVLMEATQKALQDNSLRARMMQTSGASAEGFNMSLQKAMTYMTALPGEAGKTMSQMLAQSVGRGSALLSDQAAVFTDAGMTGVVDLMDNMRAKVANGTFDPAVDAAEFNRKFIAEGMRSMSAMRLQEASGNKAAGEVIKIISEMKDMAAKNPEDIAKQTAITKFMMNFANMIEMISGKLRGKFYEGLENLMKGFEGFAESPAFLKLQDKIGDMAQAFGAFLSENLTPEKLIAFGNGIASAAEGVVKFSSFVLGGIQTVTSAFGWLSDKIGVLGAAFAVFATYLLVKNTMKKTGSLLAERFGLGGSKPESFSDALAKYANGDTLRVTIGGGDSGADSEGDNNRRGQRGRRGRRRGRLPMPGSNGGPNPRGPGPGGRFDPLRQPETSRGERITRRLERFGDAGRNFRERAAETLRRPITTAGLRQGATRGLTGIRNVPSRIRESRPVRSARAGARRATRNGMRSMRSGGSMLGRGAMGLAKGIGKGGIIGGVAAGALAMAPEFKGKDTLTSMATYGAMGSMIMPGVGTAIGAGVGAIIANWDDLSSMATDGMETIANFDYSGAMDKASAMLAPIGAGVSWVANKYLDTWKGLGGMAVGAFTAIKTFDYKGAMSKAGDMLSPIGNAAKALGSAYVNTWKSIGGIALAGVMGIKDFDYSGTLSEAGSMLGSVGSSIGQFGSYVGTIFSDVGNSVMSGISAVTDFDYGGVLTGAFDMAKGLMDSISSRFASIGSTISGMFDWATGLLTPSPDSMLGSLLGFTDEKSLTADAKLPNGPMTAPVNPTGASSPQINTDTMTAQMDAVKTQNARMMKENADIKAQMAGLMEKLAQGQAQQVGGMRDMIKEQKKGNNNLGTLADNVI